MDGAESFAGNQEGDSGHKTEVGEWVHVTCNGPGSPGEDICEEALIEAGDGHQGAHFNP